MRQGGGLRRGERDHLRPTRELPCARATGIGIPSPTLDDESLPGLVDPYQTVAFVLQVAVAEAARNRAVGRHVLVLGDDRVDDGAHVELTAVAVDEVPCVWSRSGIGKGGGSNQRCQAVPAAGTVNWTSPSVNVMSPWRATLPAPLESVAALRLRDDSILVAGGITLDACEVGSPYLFSRSASRYYLQK